MRARRARLLTGEWRVAALSQPRAILFGTRIHITDRHTVMEVLLPLMHDENFPISLQRSSHDLLLP
jgi:hypothetical protein